MKPAMWAVYPVEVDPTAALSADQKATALILITVVAAPIAGYLFARSGEAYRSIGKGSFGMDREQPAPVSSENPEALEAAEQAAEVRQMLEAKASRMRRRGEAPIDVDAEAARLLDEGDLASEPNAGAWIS